MAEVVERAAQILQDEGEQALTMRRAAAACGVTPMALYHHVTGKEDLGRLAVDHVVGACLPDSEAARAGWRPAMIAFASAFRRVFIENPGAGAIFIRRPVVGPNIARVTEDFFRILEAGGLRDAAAAEAVDAIVLVTIGSIANELSRPPSVRFRLLEHLPEEETPLMVGGIETYAHRDPEARFRAALEWMLDGIEREANRR